MCLSTAGRVASIEERGGILLASVEFEDRPSQLCMSYVAGLMPGDRVLVAGGAVLERIDEEEALERASFADILLRAFDEVEAVHEGGNES